MGRARQLVVTLEDKLTPAERRLPPSRSTSACAIRDALPVRRQREFNRRRRAAHRRTVRAFVCGLDTRTDVACEVFVFAPSDGR